MIKSLIAVLLVSWVGFSLAQDSDESKSKYANAETKKVKALGKAFGDKLRPINELLSPKECNKDKPKLTKEQCDQMVTEGYPKALPQLQKLERSDKWKSHERAHLYGLMGFVYYQLDNTKQAINYYVKAINEPDIASGVRKGNLRTVGQLYLSLEDYRNAIKYLKLWIDTQESVDAQTYAILSQSYYNLDDFNNSLKNIEIAINKEEASKSVAKENWYGIQRAIYVQRKDYKKVIQILEKLIVHYSKVNYWIELGGMYSELEDDQKRHAAYDLVNLMNGLDSQSRLMGLAYMYLSADAPYTGAKLIEEGMKDKIVERSIKNLQTVGSAYYQARDPEKAVPFLEEASKKDKTGESYARLAGIYTDLSRYKDAIRAGKEALRKGDIKRTDLLKLSIGTAHFNLREYDKALKTFRSIKGVKVKSSRDSWIAYVKKEIKRVKQLRESGIDLNKIYAQAL